MRHKIISLEEEKSKLDDEKMIIKWKAAAQGLKKGNHVKKSLKDGHVIQLVFILQYIPILKTLRHAYS